jgi:hypothetical protein
MKHTKTFESFINEEEINEAEKKTFSKDEVIELLKKFRYTAHATGSSNPNLSVAALDKFIKEEL